MGDPFGKTKWRSLLLKDQENQRRRSFWKISRGRSFFLEDQKDKVRDPFRRSECEIFSFGRLEGPESERSFSLEDQENQRGKSFWKTARGRFFPLKDQKDQDGRSF